MKLIDKDVLMAEIERKQKEEVSYCENGSFASWADHNHYFTLEDIKSFIDTLEVKEVDLKKEIGFYIETSLTGTNPVYTKGAVSCIIEKTARHFFELGMQQSKNYNNNEE